MSANLHIPPQSQLGPRRTSTGSRGASSAMSEESAADSISASFIAPPDLEIRDFARFRAWWSTDAFRLGHNAVRAELFDFYVIVTLVQRLGYRITADHAKMLSAWWIEFRGYLKLFDDAETRVLYPWIDRGIQNPTADEPTVVTHRMKEELENLRRMHSQISCDLDLASESISNLGERSTGALPVILPKVFDAIHNVLTRLVDYMSIQEESLVPLVTAVYTEDDKFVMDLLYIKHFYNGPEPPHTFNLVFLSRWMDEGGMVTYWIDTNLPKSVKTSYLNWKEEFMKRHARLIDDLKAFEAMKRKASGLASPLGESGITCQDSLDSSSSGLLYSLRTEDQQQSLRRIFSSGSQSTLFTFELSFVSLVENGSDWALDLFSFSGNAARLQLSRLCEVVAALNQLSAWTRPDWCKEFSWWFNITYRFLSDVIEADQAVLFPWILETPEGSSPGKVDVGKVIYEGRKAKTALEALNVEVEVLLENPSNDVFARIIDLTDSMVAKSGLYYGQRESLLPDYVRSGHNENEAFDITTSFLQHIADSGPNRGSLVLLVIWLEPRALRNWTAQRIKGNLRAGFGRGLKKVGAPHVQSYHDMKLRAFPDDSPTPRSGSVGGKPQSMGREDSRRLKSMGRAETRKSISLNPKSKGKANPLPSKSAGNQSRGMASMGRSALNQSKGLSLLREKSRKRVTVAAKPCTVAP